MSTPTTGRVISGTPFEFAQAEHEKASRNWHNCCQMFTRMAFGVPSDGTPTAAAGWARAKYKHPETNPLNIPRGAAVYWTGGSSGAGHAAVSRGNGMVWGTDLVRDGQVDVYPIEAVHARWGLTLVGWTEDVDGVRVWEPIAAPAKRPNIDAMRAAGQKALRANKSGRVHDAVVRALKALRVIR